MEGEGRRGREGGRGRKGSRKEERRQLHNERTTTGPPPLLARSLARFVSAHSVILLPRILSAQRSPKCRGREWVRRKEEGRGGKVPPLRNDINPGQGGKGRESLNSPVNYVWDKVYVIKVEFTAFPRCGFCLTWPNYFFCAQSTVYLPQRSARS